MAFSTLSGIISGLAIVTPKFSPVLYTTLLDVFFDVDVFFFFTFTANSADESLVVPVF